MSELLDKLSKELIYEIFYFLNHKDLLNVSSVCKSFYEIINDEYIWKSLSINKWGHKIDLSFVNNWKKFYFETVNCNYGPCDECHRFPQKVRFECMHCIDCNICENCATVNNHPKGHILVKLKAPNEKLNSHYFPVTPINFKTPCSHCAENITERMYQCKTCPDLFLCDSCFTSNFHQHHSFYKIKVPPEEVYNADIIGENPRRSWCDVKGPNCTHRCTGINWKCTICFGFDVCEKCETLSILSNTRSKHTLTHPLMKLLYCDIKYNYSDTHVDDISNHWNFTGSII